MRAPERGKKQINGIEGMKFELMLEEGERESYERTGEIQRLVQGRILEEQS